ncbi:hypothetical protein [Cohnella silvisoli]|uniref:HK97 gp10 family phage protein n=1 Tax=Cohnella silvisoli TaxID=2873699 RepID=A0ABV1L304_9BACL|nr:hypothetical protein [Cohnella silvisoli]MCD9025752.1 hypothetical protein [Cohnella silvisoli]
MSLEEIFTEQIKRRQAATFALVQHWGGRLESDARQSASWNDRTGHARQNIQGGAEQRGDILILYLSHGMRYGTFLETGTKPHVIRAKSKKGLYWGATRANGKPLIVRKVNHPGTKARPVIEPTMRRNLNQIKSDLKELWGGRQ